MLKGIGTVKVVGPALDCLVGVAGVGEGKGTWRTMKLDRPGSLVSEGV